jgi:hypothetical protein
MSSTPQVQSPLNLRLTITAGKNLEILAYVLFHNEKINSGLTTVGTVHFARFLPDAGFAVLPPASPTSQTLWVLTEYDGTFDQYIQDFVNQMGDIFDGLLSFVVDPPPLPVKDNVPAFEKWVNDHNLVLPNAPQLYSAYPTATVQTILNSLP